MGNETTEVIEESGSVLRGKLEAAMAAEKAWKSKALEALTKGTHVTPADLADVTVDELETKVAEVNKAREAERTSIFEAELKARGLSLDSIGKPAQADDPMSRVASLGSLNGTPPSRHQPEPADAKARIQAALMSGIKS
jgi:hypothetical protein